MNTTTQTLVLELMPQDVLEQRMAHVVNLVELAELMGFSINGFLDENDLIRKMRDVELTLLSDFIYKQDNDFPEVEVLKQELQLEKFHSISCRILDALGKY
jgi:hypothetical protein